MTDELTDLEMVVKLFGVKPKNPRKSDGERISVVRVGSIGRINIFQVFTFNPDDTLKSISMSYDC